MSPLKIALYGLALVCLSFVAFAESAVDHTVRNFRVSPKLPSDELTEKLMGKTFRNYSNNGNVWTLHFRTNGFVMINIIGPSVRRNGSKQWRVQDGRICTMEMGLNEECKDTRFDGTNLLVQVYEGGPAVRYIEQ